jgi:RecF/RecN/SMC N terminal domain
MLKQKHRYCQHGPVHSPVQVDAALDLSHTQNIGRMIKAHFPQSQFIVVSLKEGMFNNANVLFRTKFVDGVSTVTRTATRRQVRVQSRTPRHSMCSQPLVARHHASRALSSTSTVHLPRA